jgi:hypothetical protein
LLDEIGYAFPDEASARSGAVKDISELIAEYLAQDKAVDLSIASTSRTRRVRL